MPPHLQPDSTADAVVLDLWLPYLLMLYLTMVLIRSLWLSGCCGGSSADGMRLRTSRAPF